MKYSACNLNVFIVIVSLCVSINQGFRSTSRIKRQSGRHRDRINITKILQETEQRINNRTSSNYPTDTEAGGVLKIGQDISTCGGVYTQSQFIIETPNYPKFTPRNLNCLYIFKGPGCSSNFSLQFLDFDLNESTGCATDFLEVQGNRICGRERGTRTIFAANGALKLTLITSNNYDSNGFRILVSRSVCLAPQNDYTTVAPAMVNINLPRIIPTEYPPVLTTVSSRGYLPPSNGKPPHVVYPAGKERACCASTYSAKHFFISSPSFPNEPSMAEQCTFTIFKANPNVCRLRMHFKYFLVGPQDTQCSGGYLQVDGKLLCGCHTGLKLVSPFDGHLGNTKVFRYMLSNPGSMGFNGFALEIIQDECPKRYLPDANVEIIPKFKFYQDQFNRVGFPNVTHQEFNTDTEIYEPVDLGFRPRVVKHVYFFGTPDFIYDIGEVENTAHNINKPRDVEETTYLETTDLQGFYPSGNNFDKCRIWTSYDFDELKKNPIWQRMPQCAEIYKEYYPSSSHTGCKEYNFYKGYFQSPGYPYYYPKNVNICYRFYKQRGFCKIRLIMLDFQLEDSYDCKKDFLCLNNNFRYCGQSLSNTFTLFDMNRKPFEEIKFVTNSEISGRGFRGIYEQIPCTHTMHTPTPPTLLPPPPPPPQTTPMSTTTDAYPHTQTPPPNLPCLRNIKDDYFTIDIYDYGKDMCNFNVYRTSPNICRLEITFVTFDFPCDLEYLEIKRTRYCGNLSGRMVNVMFGESEEIIPIVYKRVSFKPGVGSGLKLHLVGRQSSIDCYELPPAARIGIEQQVHVKAEAIQLDNATAVAADLHYDNSYNNNTYSNGHPGNRTKPVQIVHNANDVSVILRKKYPEICGVVMNINEKLNEGCNVILNKGQSERRIHCNLITDNTIYVPYKDAEDRLELTFKDVETVQEIEFKEITCDNKFVL